MSTYEFIWALYRLNLSVAYLSSEDEINFLVAYVISSRVIFTKSNSARLGVLASRVIIQTLKYLFFCAINVVSAFSNFTQ